MAAIMLPRRFTYKMVELQLAWSAAASEKAGCLRLTAPGD
jgi:hypothetical protein